MARIPSYFLHSSSSWPFSIQDVVQPLTLRVQRPLVSVVSVSHRETLGLEGKFPTPGPGLDLTHALPSDGVRCILGLRTAVVTFRPFHGVSSKVLTVLTFWWLGETHLKVKEVAVSALSIGRCFNVKVLPQRQYKVFITSLLSPPLFQEKRHQSGEWVTPTWTWMIFCRWLRPVHRQLGEGSEEFALRVQQVVGDMGRVEVGSFFRGKERNT